MTFRTLPQSSSETIGWRVEGRLTAGEVEAMHGQLDAIIEDKGSARLLVDLGAMEGAEPSAVWEDLRRTVGKLDAIERMAVVGDTTWQRWLTEVSGTITPTEARYYAPEEAEAAWAWLRS
jgi:hypothetical protein